VLDPLSALLAEQAGFEAMYLGGGASGYVKTATEANLTLTQMAHAGLEIRAASSMPLILDGQCGWGDAMHMRNTIRITEAAGFAGIEIEDQIMPKRAHHHVGREHMIELKHMVAKIRVAAEARSDPDFVIIGRTNAMRSAGTDDALRRADAYRRAGADLLLVLHRTPEDARTIGERVEGPLFYMMTGGVQSIGMTYGELHDLGYKLINDPMTPFHAHLRALQRCYEAIAKGEIDPTVGSDFGPIIDHVHDMIGLHTLLGIERQTVEIEH
jgi:methylisocitrate lyase